MNECMHAHQNSFFSQEKKEKELNFIIEFAIFAHSLPYMTHVFGSIEVESDANLFLLE